MILCGATIIIHWKLTNRPSTPYSEFAIIHMPESGECPLDFHVAKKIFLRDGKGYDGCANDDAEKNTIDFLLPGESLGVIMELPEGTRPVPR